MTDTYTQSKRKLLITTYIHYLGSINKTQYKALGDLIGVSEYTIYRDIQQLVSDGILIEKSSIYNQLNNYILNQFVEELIINFINEIKTITKQNF